MEKSLETEGKRKIKMCQGLQKDQGQKIIFSQIRHFVKEALKGDRNTFFFTHTVR